MLRVRVCAAHMGGFLGPKFSRRESLFRQIFLKQGWVIQKLAKNSKNGWFPAKIHHKSGYDRNFRSLEEGTFLKTGRQTPVHPQVMYPPPLGCSVRDLNRTFVSRHFFHQIHRCTGAMCGNLGSYFRRLQLAIDFHLFALRSLGVALCTVVLNNNNNNHENSSNSKHRIT